MTSVIRYHLDDFIITVILGYLFGIPVGVGVYA